MTSRAGGKADAHNVAYDGRGRGAYLKVEKSTETLIKLCSEPPPDVTANLDANSDFSGTLEAIAELELLEASVQGDVKRSQAASSTIADAATRTELVLFMRDALYRICEMNFNGVLTPAEARKAFGEVIAAGRVLGQRDNVGKLIDLASSLMNAESPDPALIHDVIGTIRFLAVADYLLAGTGDRANDDTIARLLVTEVLGSKNVSDARRLAEGEIKARDEQIAALEAAIAEKTKIAASKAKRAVVEAAKTDLVELEAKRDVLREEQAQDIRSYEAVFGSLPAGLVSGPTDAGDVID